MSEHINYKDLPSDHLWGVIDHAQAQIELWTRRQQIALGHLVCRGEIGESYPDDLSGQL